MESEPPQDELISRQQTAATLDRLLQVLALVEHTQTIVDGTLQVRVIDLPTLIEIKRSTGRARDALVVPLLIAIRDRNA